VNITVYLPTDNGWNFLLFNKSVSGDGRVWINFTTQVNGEHYIVFEGNFTDYDATTPVITASTPNPGYQDNNTFQSATPIPRGQVNCSGNLIDGQNSVDILNFTAEKGDKVDINFTLPDAWDLFLIDSDFNKTGGRTKAGPGWKCVNFTETKQGGGDYYIAVNCPERSTSVDGPYSFKSNITPTPVMREPVIWAPLITPQTIPHNQDTILDFEVFAKDNVWGKVQNVTVNCTTLWTGKWFLEETVAEKWGGSFKLLGTNMTGPDNHTVQFKAVDNDLGSNITFANITVYFGNRGPVSSHTLTDPLLFEADEDSADALLDLDQFVTDPDSDILQYAIETGNNATRYYGELVNVSLDHRAILTIECLPDMNGVENITMNCTDGLVEYRFNITFNILPMNDPPEAPGFEWFVNDAIIETLERENMTVTFMVTRPVDIDNEPFYDYYFDYDGDGEWDENITRGEFIFYYPHTYEIPGDYTVTLMVKDGGNATATSSQNITVIEPIGFGPVWWYTGWQMDEKEGVLDNKINITWTTCEVHSTPDDNASLNRRAIDYFFEGSCSPDVDIIHIYTGSQEDDEDFFYFPTENVELNDSTWKLMAIEPKSGSWSYAWTDYTGDDPNASDGSDGPFLWFAAVAWSVGDFNIAETEADHYINGLKVLRPDANDSKNVSEWWIGGFTLDEFPPDTSVAITFDSCKIVTTEKRNTPIKGNITLEVYIEFAGTCGLDVVVIHMYQWMEIPGQVGYHPYLDPSTAGILEITPSAGIWSFELLVAYDIDQEAYDAIKKITKDLDLPEVKEKLLAVAWTADNRYNYAEKTADHTDDDKKDDDGGILSNRPLMIMIIVGIILIIVIFIVIIVVVARRKAKKEAEIREMERQRFERPPPRDDYREERYPPQQNWQQPEEPPVMDQHINVVMEAPPEPFEPIIPIEPGGPTQDKDLGPRTPPAEDELEELDEDYEDEEDDWDDEDEEDEEEDDDDDGFLDDDDEDDDGFLDFDDL